MKLLSKKLSLVLLLGTLVSTSISIHCMHSWEFGESNFLARDNRIKQQEQEAEQEENYTDLLQAIKTDNIENVETLLVFVNPNYAPRNNHTPLGANLYNVIRSSTRELTSSIDIVNNIAVLKLLLKANASEIMIVGNPSGCPAEWIPHTETIPALYLAIALGFTDVVEHLLQKDLLVLDKDWDDIVFSLTNHSAPSKDLWSFISEENKQKMRNVIPKRTILSKQKYANIHKLLLAAKNEQSKAANKKFKATKEKLIDWHKKLERNEITVDKLIQQEYEKLLANKSDQKLVAQQVKEIQNILAYFAKPNESLNESLNEIIETLPELLNVPVSLQLIIQLRQLGAKLPSNLNAEDITKKLWFKFNPDTSDLYFSAIEKVLQEDFNKVHIIEDADFLTVDNPDHDNCYICVETCYKDAITQHEKDLKFSILRSLRCNCKIWYSPQCIKGIKDSASNEYVGYTSFKFMKCPGCRTKYNLTSGEAFLEGKAFWCPKIEHKKINGLLEIEEEEEEITQEIDVEKSHLNDLKKYFSSSMIEKFKFLYESNQEADLSEVDSKLSEVQTEMQNIETVLNENIEKYLPAAIEKIKAKVESEKNLGNIDDSNTIKAILLSLTISKKHLEIIKYAKSLEV